MKSERRFLFHGHACAYSGRLYRPEDLIIASPASAALSVAGGLSEARARRQRFTPYLSVGPARASAQGRFDDRRKAVAMTHGKLAEDDLTSTTACEVEIEDIALDDKRFRVESLRGGLTARSPLKGNEPPIHLVRGTAISGVSIDGHTLVVKIDTKRFSKPASFAALARDLRKSAVFEAHDTILYTSIVSSLEWSGKPHPTAKITGHELYVPEFGRVYFGELFIERSAWRLTLMRAHLGSPIGLRVGFGDVGTNGAWYPPT
ncbi:MAG: hypothetical protein DIU54_012635 [Acidobacteriota bacterium]|jgi:hypothetical protein|nr:MAG: hypothetical protein DIU54_10115 [Acidobacteriota bacterium]